MKFTLNGQEALAQEGESIWSAAQRAGVEIPHLCHTPGLEPDGNCRACVVEVAGERTLAASCCRSVTPGMQVVSDSARARKSRALVLELLQAGLGEGAEAGELAHWSQREGVQLRPALRALRPQAPPSVSVPVLAPTSTVASTPAPTWGPAPDLSHPAIAVRMDACIQCRRCERACRDVQGNDVIGIGGRGAHSRIVFDLGDALGASSCVACGECVQACPTGALRPQAARAPGPLGAAGAATEPAQAAAPPAAPVAAPVALTRPTQSVANGWASAAAPSAQPLQERSVDSVCPFCGVGCQLSYQVRGNTIVGVTGRDGPANASRLCVKGRFGFDYVHSPQRLTRPLVRKAGVSKDPALLLQLHQQQVHWSEVFREASWDEALERAASGLRALRDAHGRYALAGFGSAKGSNEEAYLFQKLVRTGFGSNNVDHCTRLCHASSVAALLEGLGSGAVTNPVRDLENAALVLVIGSNTTANHPVAATWMKNAVRRGTRLVLADPRGTDLERHAWRSLRFRPGSDVALLNAMLYTVFEEGLVDQDFVGRRVAGADAVRSAVQGFAPEAMAAVCGIDAAAIREVARAYAQARTAMVFWGMGVSQHVHGTDNVRALIALAAVCGHIGRPGTGLHPLRGQNNVQGASDVGLIPMMYPNYQRVGESGVRARFEDLWGVALDPEPGLTVVEILGKALAPEHDPRRVRGMLIMGENPAMSDPHLHHTRKALANLQHLVVQDIFLTETAWLSDVVLPASAWPEKTGTVNNTDRMVQLGRQALTPPGQARGDLWILQQLAQRIGPYAPAADSAVVAMKIGAKEQENTRANAYFCYEGADHGVEQVFAEMRSAMAPTLDGISWQRLQREGSVTAPCEEEGQPGQAVLFAERVATDDGRIQLVPTTLRSADELPDADYPWVLITGRQLEHWHTGSMTRRSTVLDALEPEPTASLCASDLERLGLQPGQALTVASRRGSIVLRARLDNATPEGAVFIPFAYHEAAANLLTNPALDPQGKIPEFKYCAVVVQAGGELALQRGYAG